MALNNGGVSKNPLIVGCAMQAPNGNMFVHLKWTQYRKNYIKSVIAASDGASFEDYL